MVRLAGPARALSAGAAAALVMLGALAAGGCARRSDTPAPPAAAPAARIVATAGFGAVPLFEGRVAAGRSVMDGLRSLTPVTTAYGGGFVAEMAGRSSDAGARRDWFFWVDGVLADRGAADVRLGAGHQAWWDHHSWVGVTDIWAVVGAWPLPFASAPAMSADAPLDAAVREAGGTPAAGGPWRVRIGSDSELRRRDAAWAHASRDPEAAGLTARIRDGRVELLAPDGSRLVPEPAARAIAVALPTGTVPADGVLLAVAGLDDPAARAAASTIAAHPEVLRERVAVAFDRDGAPLRSAGRSGP